MNAEQKQRIAQAVSNWRSYDLQEAETVTEDELSAMCSSMAALLQELVDAPEPEPAARVTGYYAGYLSIATVDGRVLPAGTALYAAPQHQSEHHLEMVNTPAPIVPEGWRLVPYTPTALMLERAEYAVNNRPQPSKYEPSATPAIIFWTAMLNYAPEAPTPAEAQADVARDAERLDWLDERNAPHGLGWEIIQMPAGNVHIHTLTGDKAKFGSIREAIDAAMSEKGGA